MLHAKDGPRVVIIGAQPNGRANARSMRPKQSEINPSILQCNKKNVDLCYAATKNVAMQQELY
ncbi:hypothetical protein NKH24_17080 [Mesorhizobium sp. M1300]|uniref:hypothetical protein n=1 Tax=Mesorhizobium sp. M1300 TaxID=2957077 RepID=UPI00333B4838